MQNDKWNGVNPYPNETPIEKAARHKAKRAEAIALGIKNSGSIKRKTRAARNVNDKLRRTEAEAKVRELTARNKALEAENAELRRAISDSASLAAAPKRLVWPAAAASEPDPPSAPVAAPRVPSPINDYEEKERAATASPEPEEHGSDEDGLSPSLSDHAGASPVGSPSP
jgi:hypothetical protein